MSRQGGYSVQRAGKQAGQCQHQGCTRPAVYTGRYLRAQVPDLFIWDTECSSGHGGSIQQRTA